MTILTILWMAWIIVFALGVESLRTTKAFWQLLRMGLMVILMVTILTDAFFSLGLTVVAFVITFPVEKAKVA